MRIGINGYEAVVPRFGISEKTGLPNRVGSSEYCFNLITNLNKIDKKNEYWIYLPTFPPKDFPKESRTWHYKIIKKRSIWTLFDLSLSLFLKKEKLDVFFSPTHYLPVFTSTPSAISILDLSYIKYPKLFNKKDLYQLKIWSKYSVAKAKKVLTISNSSKDDIIKQYGIAADKVVVTYPGIKEISKIKYQKSNMDKIKEKYGIEGDYILFVGTLQPRKNISRLIEAFSRLSHVENGIHNARGPVPTFPPASARSSLNLPSQGSNELRAVGSLSSRVTPRPLEKNRLASSAVGSSHNYPLSLIIVGKKGWLYEEILEAPKKFGVEKRIKFLNFVPDEDLTMFYQNALCFVLPSLYEGFGLPVVEAMQYGCPVITSNVSSLPEAGGDAALYVNPNDVDDIASKINLLIKDDKLRKEMIKKGYDQVKKFSWEKTVRETLKALEEVAKK